MGSLKASADQIAPAAGGTWLHVGYVNRGSDAEWTPVPVVTAGDQVVGLGNYRASAPLPGTLPAGSEGQGWIYLALDAGAPRDVSVHFLDIATNGYTQVGSVTLQVRLP